MLNLYPEYVARNYMLFVAIAALGTIQAAAATAGLQGLQIGGRLWPRRLALAFMASAWIGGATWFVAVSPDHMSPGLAGSELIAMFALGALLAFVVSLLGGTACRCPRYRPAPPGQAALPGGCTYSLSIPCERPAGLVIVASDPDLPQDDSARVAEAVLRRGFACVDVSWPRSGPKYPDALAIVPATVAALGESRPWTHPLVVVGLGLGGDLALRAAQDDSRVELAVAVGPSLAPSGLPDGLLLLREMSIFSALAWRSRWDRLAWLRGLRSAEALEGLAGRAALLMSDKDGLSEGHLVSGELSASVRWRTLHVGHRELVATHAPSFVQECLQVLREGAVAGV